MTTDEKQSGLGLVANSSSAFWKYWAAFTTGRTGAGVTAVALPLLALTVLNVSNFEAGMLTVASYAPVVLIGLPAGVVVRRYYLRGLQITMDIVRAVAVLTIPLAAWWDVLTLSHLLVVAFVVGLAGSLFDVANLTFLPQVVSKNELISRNGLLSGTEAATGLLGPSLGGILVQVLGAASSIVVNAFAYLASAAFLSRIPPTPKLGEPADEELGFFQQVWDGLHYVLRHPVIRPAVIVASALNFASGAILAVTAPFLVRTLELPAAAVGVVLAIDGLGAIIGAFITSRLVERWGDARAIRVATAIGAVLSLAMPLAVTGLAPVIFGFGLGVFGAGVALFSVVARSHRQTVSPPELLSRVMASVRFISWSAIPVGAAVAGVLAEVIAPRAGLVLACVAAFVAPVVLWASRVRHLQNLVDAEDAEDAERATV